MLLRPQAVLFACNHNVVRSPMAAGLFRRRFGNRIWVDSAGVRPGDAIDPFVVFVMDELGMDLFKHRPKGFEDLEDASFDVIVTLSPEAHHRALEFTRSLAVEVEYWRIFDPTIAEGSREARMAQYRAVRDDLDRRIAERFEAPARG